MPVPSDAFTDDDKAGLVGLREQFSLDQADDSTCVRFLRARAHNVDATAKMIGKALEWRATFRPEAVRVAELSNSLPSGCWRYLGKSKARNQIVLVLTRLWNPQDYDVAEYGRYIAWWQEQLQNNHDADVHQTVLVMDMRGWQLSHAYYMSFIKTGLDILQNYYPETLKSVFMLHVPYIFQAAWRIISPWLDKRVAAKVRFLSDAEYSTVLCDELGAEYVPRDYGGDAEMPGCPNIPGVENVELYSSIIGNRTKRGPPVVDEAGVSRGDDEPLGF